MTHTIEERLPIGLGDGVILHLWGKVVVVGIKELGHIQCWCLRHTTGGSKVLLEALQMLYGPYRWS